MKTLCVRISLESGRIFEVRKKVSETFYSQVTSSLGGPRGGAEFEFFDNAIQLAEVDIREVRSFQVKTPAGQLGLIRAPYVRTPISKEPAPARRKVERCHSILRLANIVLPPRVRDEALDEWVDEIECAAAEKKPVLRRTLSIVFRSLPSLALRARLPARARREGGS